MANKKNIKVKIELDEIKSAVLLDVINARLDDLLEQSSMESMIKYFVLREIGKDIIDQVMPESEQEALMQKHKKDETILQALKKEKGK